jgi:hypothetical protein
MTAGEGTFTMAMDHYAPAPPAVQRSLEEALASRRAG